MTIANECKDVAIQTSLVEHDQVIQAFASNSSDHAFDKGTLPGLARCRQHLFDAHRLHLLDEVMAEDAITIAQ